MKIGNLRRGRISRKISSALASERPLRTFAESISKVARSAMEEANTLTVEGVEIYLNRLPKKLDGFRLAHLSDIHHSPFTDMRHILSAVEIVNGLAPDAVMLTGDYVSHETEYIEPMADALGLLKSELGSFACLGNHDHWTDAELVRRHLERNGIKVLVNQGVRLITGRGSFWLAGVDDYMVGKTDVRASLEGAFAHELKVLLAHNPVIARQAARRGIDLMLSGHTHGGQVKLGNREGSLIAKRRMTSGLHRRYETQIYVTRGIGTVVLPVRYQCPPEISLITLRCVEQE